MKIQSFLICLLLLGFLIPAYADAQKVSMPDDTGDKSIINIGVIVDMGSWVGKVVHSSIMMALSDFYNLNTGYKTRISLQVRDSKGDSLHCIAAALDLLENVEVHAMIIPELSSEELFLARLSDKANVPLLSLSPIPSAYDHPYLIQVSEYGSNQFHAIADFLEAFKWRNIVCLYEDTSGARLAQTYIHDILQENNLDIAYQSAISLGATDDQIITELHKLMKLEASIILLHLSPSLASQVFMNAKLLQMMSNGIVWILTSKTMNFLHSLDSSVYESMQGVIGFKSYILETSKIQNLTLRWRRDFQQAELNVEMRELNAFGVWAYDAAWVLAGAIERTGIELSPNSVERTGLKHLAELRVSDSGSAILSEIKNSEFTKLLGKPQILDIYEILNLIGKGERRVGFWTSANGLTEEINPSTSSSSNNFETIIWPGFSSIAPKRRLLQTSGKRLRIGFPAHGRFPELVNFSYNQQSNQLALGGFCGAVFNAAVKRLEYEISFEYVAFENQNGSYNDLVYEVYKKNFDAAVGDITILSNRSKYVDFTVPYTEMGVGIVVKLNDKDAWFFLKPLDTDLWIMSACFFLLTGFIVWLVEHRANEEFQGSFAQQIGVALWFAASTLVYAHRERLRSNVSRFVVSVWLFVVLILTSSYTAKLSSILTVEQIKFTKNDYIGYSANSFLVKNTNFKDNRLKLYHSPEDYDDAFKKGSKKGGIGALMEELPYLRIFLTRYPNEYAIVESEMTTSGFGFAFPIGSALGHNISRAITELREEGILEQMQKQWFSGQSPPLSQITEQTDRPNALSTENFFGLFLLSGISKSIAVVIVIIFLLREKLSMNYSVFTALARGRLIFILRYFYPQLVHNLEGVGGR